MYRPLHRPATPPITQSSHRAPSKLSRTDFAKMSFLRGLDAIPLREIWVCLAPIALQGWHSYLSDGLSCSKPAYLPTGAPFQDPGNWRRVEGEVQGRRSSLGPPPQLEADKRPSRTERRHSEGLDSPLCVLCQTSLSFCSPFFSLNLSFQRKQTSHDFFQSEHDQNGQDKQRRRRRWQFWFQRR